MKSERSGEGKGAKTKPMSGPGTEPAKSALIGGISNRTTTPSFKKQGKVGSFNKGGKAK